MALQPQRLAPDFTADAVVDGRIEKISLSNYQGKYVLLFFYPLDFTFVCPTEIVAFSDRHEEFERRGTQVIAVSVDSAYSHLAWAQQPRSRGGLGTVSYPLVSDLTKSISSAYGVLLEKQGVALRGLFLIDKGGVIRHMVINDLPIGRSVDEAIRVLDGLQQFEQHGEVCPADWRPGAPTIKPDPLGSKSYFHAHTKARESV